MFSCPILFCCLDFKTIALSWFFPTSFVDHKIFAGWDSRVAMCRVFIATHIYIMIHLRRTSRKRRIPCFASLREYKQQGEEARGGGAPALARSLWGKEHTQGSLDERGHPFLQQESAERWAAGGSSSPWRGPLDSEEASALSEDSTSLGTGFGAEGSGEKEATSVKMRLVERLGQICCLQSVASGPTCQQQVRRS